MHTVLLAIVLLLSPWTPNTANYNTRRLAAAQGLSVPDESLGAGEAAVFDVFSQFEDTLELSEDFTGGRGTRGKRTSRRAAFEDAQSLRQQQLELYHVAGSPAVYHSFNRSQTIGGKNYLPTVGDQGTCSTCVAYAVTAAATASVASTLRVDATEWDISPQSLYYCSAGGKTCASGWQIDAALDVLQNNPGIIRPSNCIAGNLVEPEIGSWTGVCAAAASKCPVSDMSLPWLTCSYKALSTFWQIQQAIRQHGAVVTRITIYDDFRPFFDPSKTGLENGIYTPRPGARKLYGHAAVIVGYDNLNKAWTLLNSWGTSSTKNGLFRIAMGQAGVGVPDETYAVICEPKAGTDLDIHEVRPWLWEQRRPVRLVSPEDRDNLKAPCYYYDAKAPDTAAAVADAFLLDVRNFVQDNIQVFKPITVSTSFNESLTAVQITTFLTNIKLRGQAPGAAEPYFLCTDAHQDIRKCYIGASLEPCAGIINCTLVYQEPDVAISPANKELLVCNISLAPGQFDSVAQFENPRISQLRALRSLLDRIGYFDVPIPSDPCFSMWWGAPANPRAALFRDRWVRQCDDDGWVIDLDADIGLPTDPETFQLLDRSLVETLLVLKKLKVLKLVTTSGSTLVPQLGALSSMQSFTAASTCWQGGLPSTLGRGWRKLESIILVPFSEVQRSVCGIQGTLPVEWGTTMQQLSTLYISSQRITGTLPEEYSSLTYMAFVDLSGNELRGTLPSYAEWTDMYWLDVSNNRLEGVIPPGWSKRSGKLMRLNVQGNSRMRGCIPLTATTVVLYEGTQMTGWCSDNKREIEEQQWKALSTLLPPLLDSIGRTVWPALVAILNDLRIAGSLSGIWDGNDGRDNFFWSRTDDRGHLHIYLGLRNNVVYITELIIQGGWLNATVLPDFLSQLPGVESFRCESCAYSITQLPRQDYAALELPASLADKAPRSLKALTISGSGLRGTLPREWGTWDTLYGLNLHGNSLSGTLPASWKGMSSLKFLYLSGNGFEGTLPPEWGGGGISRLTEVWLSYNPGLVGTLPAAWSTFQGGLFLLNTNLTGCVPDQLVSNVQWGNPVIACSQNSSEVASLLKIRELVDPTGAVLVDWTRNNSGPLEQPGTFPPGYCRKFQGVTCNRLNQVASLDLSELSTKRLRGGVPLQRLLHIATRLPALKVLKLSGNAALFSNTRLRPETLMRSEALQHLDLSNCGLSGPFPPSLAGAFSLQHLILSGNPMLSGPLPDVWAGLTDLQVLDITGCGVTGVLPGSWASMQQLRVFRASDNRPGLSGQLPESWGMLRKLEVLEINRARLTGSLPVIWADPTALAARAASLLTAARRRAAEQPALVANAEGGPQMERLAKAAADAALAALQQAVVEGKSGTRRAPSLGMLKLQDLGLSGNKLTGPLPAKFSGMTNLRQVLLDGNRFTGQLPLEWAALEQLQELNLSRNRLSGTLPAFWGSLLKLEVLVLSNNPFSGTLPGPWGGLRSLQRLELGSCNMRGELPVAWFGLRQVRTIDVSGNLLKGGIPVEWGVMGNSNGYNLRRLDLSNNPCTNNKVLQESISRSRIETSGRVTVNAVGIGSGGSACD